MRGIVSFSQSKGLFGVALATSILGIACGGGGGQGGSGGGQGGSGGGSATTSSTTTSSGCDTSTTPSADQCNAFCAKVTGACGGTGDPSMCPAACMALPGACVTCTIASSMCGADCIQQCTGAATGGGCTSSSSTSSSSGGSGKTYCCQLDAFSYDCVGVAAADDCYGNQFAASCSNHQPAGAACTTPYADCTIGKAACSTNDDCGALKGCNSVTNRCFDPVNDQCKGTPCNTSDDCSGLAGCNTATGQCN